MNIFVCLIQGISYETGFAIRRGTFTLDFSHYDSQEPVQLTKEQSLSRFLFNPNFKVELLPEEHSVRYIALIHQVKDGDIDQLINKPNLKGCRDLPTTKTEKHNG